MICKKCQTFYVRDPCPNCGHDSSKRSDKENDADEGLSEDSVKPSKIRKKETSSGNQVLVQEEEEEERLVKPSDRFRKEVKDNDDMPSFQRLQQEEDDDEPLVKPSDRIKQEREDDDDIPSFQRFDSQSSDDKFVRPIQSKKKEEKKEDDEIPSFQRYQRDQEVDVSNISKLNKPDQQEKLRNDEEYRNKVKETLEEVMGLLEKLIDDE